MAVDPFAALALTEDAAMNTCACKNNRSQDTMQVILLRTSRLRIMQ